MEKATFAAGCFWCLEETFSQLEGVQSTTVGYTGGDFPNPTYQNICTGNTGHVEAIQVVFDPSLVSYKQLLNIFWNCHDPTSVDRQGANIGSQYRSAIFYHSEEQKAAAIASKERLQNQLRETGMIATNIVPEREFYPAEEYHQHYFAKRKLGNHVN
ncbi:MAG: methionine sulfoxide reductase A [Gammaproteobacteria bacterium SG8_11]|nr:MAG: methionine sulfoxide reductase A [Gammaproteobacteria bacterium SG8_11]